MLTRKEVLKQQRKEINRSFAKQISKKDKRIHELEKDLWLNQSAILDMMDACKIAEEKEAKTRQSLNSLTAEFSKLKRTLKRREEI